MKKQIFKIVLNLAECSPIVRYANTPDKVLACCDLLEVGTSSVEITKINYDLDEFGNIVEL